jgi:cellulose biosynthesis protein BcsQ
VCAPSRIGGGVPRRARGLQHRRLTILTSELGKISKNFHRNVLHRRIVCNNLNKSFSRHLQFLEALQAMDYELYTVPQDAKLAEAQVHNKSVFDYAPDARSRAEIERLADALAGVA